MATPLQTGILQNIPAFTLIILGVAGIGVLPYGVHRLFVGERKVGRDQWDFLMDNRDAMLKRNANKPLRAPAEPETKEE